MKQRFYKNKLVIAGDVIELYEYERPICLGEQRGNAGRNGGGSAPSERDLEYRERTLTNARRTIRRLINANINAWGCKPKFVTLTFAEHITEPKVANYEFKKFRQRLEYVIKDKLKYVCVIEFQKSGRIHYHVIFFNLKYMSVDTLFEIWGNGFVWINAIDNVDNVGAYITKYMSKDNDDERLRSEKCYFSSRGLVKWEEKVVNEKEIAEMKEELSRKKVYENEFDNEYVGKITYSQYNLKRC